MANFTMPSIGLAFVVKDTTRSHDRLPSSGTGHSPALEHQELAFRFNRLNLLVMQGAISLSVHAGTLNASR